MLRFLFWNINRKPIEGLIAELAEEHAVDVLVLAECATPAGAVLQTINNRSAIFHFHEGHCNRVAIFTRFIRKFHQVEFETKDFTIRSLTLPASDPLLIAAAHLPSKLRWSDSSQGVECAEFAACIRRVEEGVGHRRTVVIGDLNLNPFEIGIFAADKLNAVMTKELALRRAPAIKGRQFPFFYNPMWGRFGDRTEGPPGTYYYVRPDYERLYWHIFDQVLLRPELIPFFRDEELKILDRVGSISLLDGRGLPDRAFASDHLPILFSLDI